MLGAVTINLDPPIDLFVLVVGGTEVDGAEPHEDAQCALHGPPEPQRPDTASHAEVLVGPQFRAEILLTEESVT